MVDSTVQYSTVQYSTVQYSTVQYLHGGLHGEEHLEVELRVDELRQEDGQHAGGQHRHRQPVLLVAQHHAVDLCQQPRVDSIAIVCLHRVLTQHGQQNIDVVQFNFCQERKHFINDDTFFKFIQDLKVILKCNSKGRIMSELNLHIQFDNANE